MYSISPAQTELFHLRLLLLNVKGAVRFIGLKTVNGTLYETFAATCLALGLVEDDTEWERTLSEAQPWMMPVQLRKLFVRILLYCHPAYPERLWEKFKHSMSEDFLLELDTTFAYKKTYFLLNDMLISEGSGLNKFPTMKQLIDFNIPENDNMSLIDHQRIGEEQYVKLNEKQKNIVDTIMNSTITGDDGINIHNSNCFYIDGPGGSGKTFIYTTLYHLLVSKQRNVCTMAFTGIAATLLPHGRTVHKVFGMPVPLHEDSTSNIKNNSNEYHYLKNLDIIIWDEAPMAPRYALELVNSTLCDICNDNSPFGGKIIVLGGDFRQLLPIKLNATRTETINLSIKFSKLWKHFKISSLTQNMLTLPEEVEFAEFVLSVGNGSITNEHDYVTLPQKCVASKDADIVVDVYADAIRNRQYDNFTMLAILSPRNIDVDLINDRVVNLLDAESEKIYNSVDSTENSDSLRGSHPMSKIQHFCP